MGGVQTKRSKLICYSKGILFQINIISEEFLISSYSGSTYRRPSITHASFENLSFQLDGEKLLLLNLLRNICRTLSNKDILTFEFEKIVCPISGPIVTESTLSRNAFRTFLISMQHSNITCCCVGVN